MVPIIVHESPNRVVMMRWGLVPFWAKDPKIGSRLINARAETLAEKPAFRNSLKKYRCLVPATGFYEWRKTARGKVPYHLCLKEHSLFSFAGLYATGNLLKGKNLLPSLLSPQNPIPLLVRSIFGCQRCSGESTNLSGCGPNHCRSMNYLTF